MKQSRRHTLLRLWRFLRPHGLSLLLTALLLVLANLLTLALPLFSGWAVDAIGLKAGHVDFSGVLRSWAVVYLGNLIGALAVAALAVYSHQLGQFSGALAALMPASVFRSL